MDCIWPVCSRVIDRLARRGLGWHTNESAVVNTKARKDCSQVETRAAGESVANTI